MRKVQHVLRVGNGVSDWFPVRAGLRKGCLMSPWLLNVYMVGVLREVEVREKELEIGV